MKVLIILAFAAIYLIWGSTYLAIKLAIGTLPPFGMAATRFLIAGTILFTWACFTDSKSEKRDRQSLANWRRAFIIGALLLLCGNGGVTWAERYIASGLAALLVATEPLWVVMLNWILESRRPNARVIAGVLIGLAGVALLVSGEFNGSSASTTMRVGGAGAVFVASLAWAGGSVYSARHPMRTSAARASGMQMLAGGTLLLIVSLVTGELSNLRLSAASWLSLGALLYLIVFGSVVAFTAYSWLLKTVSTALASTYAYVNPVVAVGLGWLIASEPLTIRVLVAAVVIIASVVIITTYGKDRKPVSETEDSSARKADEATDLGGCANHPCA